MDKKAKGKGGQGAPGKGQPSKKRKNDEDGKKWQPRSILQESGDGPANKKRALRRQRASTKPHFEAVSASKTVWNELREKKCPEARRAQLVGELHAGLKGNYAGVAMKHDAARLVQAVVQYGSEAQRSQVMDELTGRATTTTSGSSGSSGSSGGGEGGGSDASFAELCRSPYGHYVVVKLLEHSRSKELQKKLARALSGFVVGLATHSVGARIVELALCGGGCLKPAQSSGLRLELYGKEFTVFADEMKRDLELHQRKVLGLDAEATNVPTRPTLASVLAVRPDKRERVLGTVSNLVGKLAQKGLLAFQYAHEILGEYLEEVDEEKDGSALEECLGPVVDNCLVLLSTRPGTKAVCLAAAKGQAKDRRRLLKLVKGHAAALLTHRDAYLAVMELCEVVDDTVALQKSLLGELCVEPTAEELASEEVFSANPFLDNDKDKKKGKKDKKGGKAAAAAEEEEEDEEEEGGDDEEGEDEGAMEDDAEDAEDGAGGDDDDEDEEEDEEDTIKRAVPLLSVALHPNGSKLLLRVLAGSNSSSSSSSSNEGRDEEAEEEEEAGSSGAGSGAGGGGGSERYLDPYEVSTLALPSSSSKKDPQVRRDELRAFLQEPLLCLVANHATLLLKSRAGAAVCAETLKCYGSLQTDGGGGGAKEEAGAGAEMGTVSAAAFAVAAAAGECLDHPVAHAALKRILLAEGEAEKTNKAAEAEAGGSCVLSQALVSSSSCDLGRWALGSNRGAFVVWALLQVPSQASKVAALLTPTRSELEALASEGEGGGGEERRGGNKGAALVVEVLNILLPATAGKQSKAEKAKTPGKTPGKKGKATAATAAAATTEKGAVKTTTANKTPTAKKAPGSVKKAATAVKAEKKFSPAATRSSRKAPK
jgi:hypothetical protein